MPTCQHCGNTFETVADLPFHGAGLCTPKTMSTPTQHTPGQWRLVKRANQCGLQSLIIDTGRLSGGTYCKTGNGKLTSEDEANARRIVQCVNSFPDLLWLAERMLTINANREQWTSSELKRSLENWMDEARAAIAKAKGNQ